MNKRTIFVGKNWRTKCIEPHYLQQWHTWTHWQKANIHWKNKNITLFSCSKQRQTSASNLLKKIQTFLRVYTEVAQNVRWWSRLDFRIWKFNPQRKGFTETLLRFGKLLTDDNNVWFITMKLHLIVIISSVARVCELQLIFVLMKL